MHITSKSYSETFSFFSLHWLLVNSRKTVIWETLPKLKINGVKNWINTIDLDFASNCYKHSFKSKWGQNENMSVKRFSDLFSAVIFRTTPICSINPRWARLRRPITSAKFTLGHLNRKVGVCCSVSVCNRRERGSVRFNYTN